MEIEGFGVAVTAVQRWLPLGRDVLVRGDRGAGKSTVLEALLADASRRGLTGLLLRASGPDPLAALIDHASAPPRTRDESALTSWLTDELTGRRSLLLLDDLDRMDARSLAVVRRVLARTGAVLVASATGDPLRDPSGAVADLLVERAPAEVRVPPFGFRAVSVLLASVLGAPADAGLISAVTAQTGGNPRAVVALADAARAAGVLRRVDGLWVEDGTLGEIPVDPVAYVFLAGLRAELVAALELLAGTGPVPADVAARLVDCAVLTELAEAGRVVSHEVSGTGETLGVAPPVLARALRERVGPYRRRQLAERAGAEGGRAFEPREPSQDGLTEVLLKDSAGEGDDYWRWTADLAGMLHERAAAEENARRAEWLATPTLATANAYLAVLMRRPAEDLLRAVFAATRPTARDTPEDRLVFAFYRSRWAAWTGASSTDVDAELDSGGPELRPFVRLRDLKRRLLTELAAGRDPDEVAAEPEEDVPVAVFRGWPAVVRAAALLEAGHPAQAVTVCTATDVADAEPEVRHYLAAVHGEALLMTGRTAEAERWARRMLDTAYDEVDALGIRVHACVLAHVLLLTGQPTAAWRVVSTAMRLGPPGPVETTFHRRALTIGALLQARAGNVTLAQVLVRELDKTPHSYHPLLRSLRVIAHLATSAAAGDTETPGQAAWQAGQRYAEAGLLQPALIAWIAGPASLTPARARVVRDVLARTAVPQLAPYAEVLLGLADDDREAVAAALPGTLPSVTPTLVALGRDLVGADAVVAGTTGPPARRAFLRIEPLSSREREVATLAREGLSNRQIAERLQLSVRTVENHMSRALRKLGFANRGDLLGWREG